jgi:hypothetical protein
MGQDHSRIKNAGRVGRKENRLEGRGQETGDSLSQRSEDSAKIITV